ncbi:FAD-dependent oxidoreductase [Paenibacillus sp. TRM 82003]|uniref:FAD-dependent oxidoreductase n=1 Tax=Kineococcus sp. TRM81007 TaxID=2925831 RepID=UPI001F589750|nr:FAD-dependent oxidoreductase [Kineococcus sp. TRM81007]MCI2238455.1 FAD-dependent oxidoreductase [Kineococcus sp. TRM81007]MCI3922031.1 FAD-dependent oxidoreductase [Paenibacillus sp. TRM 82003]
MGGGAEQAERTRCVVAGGGPAGVVLGLLLARAGVPVLVLEKHDDFLRDFRGDTVHPSTLRLLDEVGLADEFLRLPHSRVRRAAVTTDDGTFEVADFSRLRGRFPFLALVPQWDFLDLLAARARRYPGFELRTGAEVTGLLREGGRVVGVRYRQAAHGGGPGGGPAGGGAERSVRAVLTVAADGRGSVLREDAGLRLREFGAGVDVLWFRLPRPPGAVTGVRASSGRFVVVLDRGDYLQCAFVVPSGGLEAVRAGGAAAFRADLARLLPALAPVVGALADLDEVHVLRVRIDRLRRWYRDGLLVIGDAAHAMSPVGGVGVNLAVQDAVAAARILAGPLRRGAVSRRDLARVQRRRWLPVALTQAAQRVAHRRVLGAALAAAGPVRAPRALRLLARVPVLRVLPAAAIGLGVLPEHAPPERVAPDTSAMYR